MRKALTLIAVTLLAACGSQAGVEPVPEPRPAPSAKQAAPARPGSVAPRIAPEPVVINFVPPRPPTPVEKPSAPVEACIEKNIHGADYDNLAPRDARRKLRRLQVKADCEEQLAAR
jgi:hypothetical protein